MLHQQHIRIYNQIWTSFGGKKWEKPLLKCWWNWLQDYYSQWTGNNSEPALKKINVCGQNQSLSEKDYYNYNSTDIEDTMWEPYEIPPRLSDNHLFLHLRSQEHDSCHFPEILYSSTKLSDLFVVKLVYSWKSNRLIFVTLNL